MRNIWDPITLPAPNTGVQAFPTLKFHAIILILESNIFVFVGEFVHVLIFCGFGLPTNSMLETLSRLLNLCQLKLGSALVMQVKVLLLIITS